MKVAKRPNVTNTTSELNSFASNWPAVARLCLLSRAIDRLEETVLYPQKHIAYQFSAGGHELAQLILGALLTNPLDAATVYYRSRPLLLSLGLTPVEAFAGPLGKQGSLTSGRDIGVVFHLPSRGKARVLPMAGDVGGQYTPAVGWAEALRYRLEVLDERQAESAIAVVLGGEGSVVTNGFWSALNVATSNRLPVLFFIEDNGYAISVPAELQVPGGDIAPNLASYKNLTVLQGDGTDPAEASQLITNAVATVRAGDGPVLLRLKVPRLPGHSIQDNQLYKGARRIAAEKAQDPLPKLRDFLVPRHLSAAAWTALANETAAEAERAMHEALALPAPSTDEILAHRFSSKAPLSVIAGTLSVGAQQTDPDTAPTLGLASSSRLSMAEAVRATLEHEVESNPALVVFGEDVGAKGGVHGVTIGLQSRFGARRVFDTSLSEEGIVGRAVGMSLGGLRPVAEIQFRKYLDTATEQMHNCGTMRWRTAGAYAAPIVIRLAGGFSRRAGDPWHSMSAEVELVRSVGWHVYMPATVRDAVGLLRYAMRGDDPVMFFEHRAMLNEPDIRDHYPGNSHIVRPGVAAVRQSGSSLTVVTWGGLVERCLQAARSFPDEVTVIDLRTLAPWDRETVLESVKRTHRLLIVHEDSFTAGFGAEISAVVADEAFRDLDAPIRRIAPLDVPIPYHPDLMQVVVPTTEVIANAIGNLLEF